MNTDAAVRYNKSRGYTRQQWQRAQMVLGARPDGLPGPETATQIAFWQAENTLIADGMLGPNTMSAMLEDVAPWSSITEVAVYWDCPARWSVANSTQLARTLADHGIDCVKIMLTSNGDHEWNPQWTTKQLDHFTTSLQAVGIHTCVTAWFVPHPAVLKPMAIEIPRFLESAIRFEGDAEEHLLEKRLPPGGYPKDRVELMSDMVAVLDAARMAGVVAGVSTYADLFGKSDRFHNDLVAAADVFSLQSYQVEGGKGQGAAFSSSGPALKQYDSIKRTRERVDLPAGPMSVAVSMWDQDFDGPISDDSAQLLSVEQCVRMGIPRIDGWSALHWIAPASVTKKYDKRKAEYNSRFFMRLKALRAGGGVCVSRDDITTPPMGTGIARPASSGTRAAIQGAQIKAVDSSISELRRELRETMTTISTEIRLTGEHTLEAIRMTAEKSAVREQATLDTLTQSGALAMANEEREKRREARELEDRERQQKRDDEDRAFELEERASKAAFDAQERQRSADAKNKLRNWVVGAIIGSAGAGGILWLAIEALSK